MRLLFRYGASMQPHATLFLFPSSLVLWGYGAGKTHDLVRSAHLAHLVHAMRDNRLA